MGGASSTSHDLLPFAASCALGAVGLAAVANPPGAATVVANLVSGLAINYAAGKMTPLLGRFGSEDWSSTNYDLDRVAAHALLCILYETLTENGTKEGEAAKIVKAAGDAWSLSIFRDACPGEGELIAFLRKPCPMPVGQAEQLARQILIGRPGPQAAYSQALSKRFARTFEVLLRGDERAFRAAVVYLQRLSLTDIAHLTGELARAVELLTRPQPLLERYEALRRSDGPVLPSDLQFKRRATRYRPRASSEASIREWIESKEAFRILEITGPAGMGKSRLALELCDEYHREHWLSGFIRDGECPRPWTPNRDTLAVLDYAGSKSVAGQPAFAWIESIFLRVKGGAADGQAGPPRVRIILVDRQDQGELWSQWRSSELGGDLDALTLSIKLDPDRGEFDAIVRDEFLRRTGREPSAAENEGVAALAGRLKGQFRPLFASLTAAAVADPPPASTQRWSPELLVENMLYAQQQQWSRAGITDEHLDLLFEATLTQGCDDPELRQRLEALSPATLAALASLSDPDPGRLLGPIMPDLLGEFFILMRLRGEATTGARLQEVNMRKAGEALARYWGNEKAAEYAGRILEDYLDWAPQKGSNPAADIMQQALAQVEAGANSLGLQVCCFVAAWKKPWDRDWAAWLRRVPEGSRTGIVDALAMGLMNATVDERDPVQRRALVEGIEGLHEEYGHEPTVREELAKALYNATVVEPDPAERRELADQIETLHEKYGYEPAVREQLAKALYNATVGEPDPAECRDLAKRIDTLHAKYGREPAVRELLAEALYNATVVEPDPAQSRELVKRIEMLHEKYGHEPAVRERLAKALFNATVGERDPGKRRELARRIETLHEKYGYEPAVREQLAKALYNATVDELNPEQRAALITRLERLAQQYPEDKTVAEMLRRARAADEELGS